jgi:hypothetical protein
LGVLPLVPDPSFLILESGSAKDWLELLKVASEDVHTGMRWVSVGSPSQFHYTHMLKILNIFYKKNKNSFRKG